MNGLTGPLSSSAIKWIIFNFEWGIILYRSDSPKTKTILTCSWADKSKSNHEQVTYFHSVNNFIQLITYFIIKTRMSCMYESYSMTLPATLDMNNQEQRTQTEWYRNHSFSALSRVSIKLLAGINLLQATLIATNLICYQYNSWSDRQGYMPTGMK